ncbi:hypothetical protein ACFE04_022258 [Oxalis oulophora]
MSSDSKLENTDNNITTDKPLTEVSTNRATVYDDDVTRSENKTDLPEASHGSGGVDDVAKLENLNRDDKALPEDSIGVGGVAKLENAGDGYNGTEKAVPDASNDSGVDDITRLEGVVDSKSDKTVDKALPESSNGGGVDGAARLENAGDPNGTDDKALPKAGSGGVPEQPPEEKKKKKSCFNRILDLKEAKKQIFFSFPMILTNVAYYCITMVSVMFAGHLGSLELAGASLANSWATVTGYAFMIGLGGAIETLCGQAFGAQLYRSLGLYLQSSCMISFFFAILISILWWFTEPVLGLLHQDESISKETALYMKFLIPSLFAYGLIQNILRFLQTQFIVFPLAAFSVLSMVIHIGVAYSLVHWTSLGIKGAALSVSISLWISAFVLAIYVLSAKKFKLTWEGFSSESLSYVKRNMKLAVPSAAMVCLEYWAFEILVFLAGLMPDALLSTSLIGICVQTETIAFMIAYGLSAATSTRVSNKLGAGKPEQAKHVMVVAVKLSVLVALTAASTLAIGHDFWIRLFTDSDHIIKKFAALTPFLTLSITLDAVQGVLSGVARGCGWQHLAVYVNLANFYLIGMPISIILAFIVKLYDKIMVGSRKSSPQQVHIPQVHRGQHKSLSAKRIPGKFA